MPKIYSTHIFYGKREKSLQEDPSCEINKRPRYRAFRAVAVQ